MNLGRRIYYFDIPSPPHSMRMPERKREKRENEPCKMLSAAGEWLMFSFK